jgi:putative oxidoreductase
VSAAILLIRLTLAAIFICHGLQKWLGVLQGPGMDKSVRFFESIGHRPGRPNVALSVGAELLSGTLFALGLLTPLAGAVAIGTMLTAGASVSAAQRIFWNAAGGGEYPLVLAVISAAVTQAGAGRYSLDALSVIGTPGWPEPARIAAIVVGVVGAVIPTTLAIRKQRVRPA